MTFQLAQNFETVYTLIVFVIDFPVMKLLI